MKILLLNFYIITMSICLTDIGPRLELLSELHRSMFNRSARFGGEQKKSFLLTKF